LVAGIVHAFTLLLIMLFVGKWAAFIPMATLAGILVVVAYHMCEWQSFVSVLKGPGSDIAIMLTTFLLTVLVDLTVAIEIGIVLAAFLFMRQMIQFSDVNAMVKGIENNGDINDEQGIENFTIPDHVEVFEITGPLFFGAAYKFREAMKFIERRPRILILRMRMVPFIDATGIKTIREVYKELNNKGTKLILSEVQSQQVKQELGDARLLFAIGKANVTETFTEALTRCELVLAGK
ncbi:MAG TPA: STAS domain-containing protein, partial [Chitinophagaceae bacterium]